jgi:NAD+ kinase
MSPRTVGLIANTSKPGAAALVPQIAAALRQRGLAVCPDAEAASLLGERERPSRAELARRCDLLLILGGDGTLLEAVRDTGEECPPVLGINAGTLGFLTSVTASAWEQAVSCIAEGSFRIEERTLLRVESHAGGTIRLVGFALNDAVVSRGERSQLIRLDVRVDGARLSEYNADGLIIATPTGSTAYALSAGGPVLTPDSGVFVIAPVCPHVLTMRPVIVGDQSRIEIAPLREDDVLLTIDGDHPEPVAREAVIVIRKADRRLRLATLPETTFFEVLRQKLKWSGTAV